MVERARGAKHKKNRLLAGHQRSWVWGRNAVLEILAAPRWEIRDLLIAEDAPPELARRMRDLAAERGVALQTAPADRLRELCHSGEHQGCLARLGPYPYADFESLLAETAAPGAAPLFALLDAMQDPFNFGAVARSAEALGVDALVVGETRQARVNSQVVRSSAGAVARIRIASVADLCDAARRLREAGCELIAASEKADAVLAQCPLSGPAAIVLGNEGAGVRPEILDHCTRRVRIPQRGAVGSLNVAAAAAVFFYEAARQRDGGA